MIRIADFQLKIQKQLTGEIFHPPIRSFSTIDSLPLENSPEATINIISSSNLNPLQTTSLVEFDDIVRLQGSIRYSVDETPVWIDIFEGRVQNQSKTYGDGNTVSLDCVGHVSEAFEMLQCFDHTWTDTDAKVIIATISAEGHKLGRVEYSADDIETGLVIPTYNIESYQVFLSDVLQDIEKLSGYKRFFSVRSSYDSYGSLLKTVLVFKQFSTIPTEIYKVVEGTARLISATFDVVGEDVKTFRYVRGGTDATGVQYTGDAADAVAVATYGPRYEMDTFTWVKSNSLCIEIAKGLVSDSSAPTITGNVTLEGTLDAKVGDLVTVQVDSLDIKGVTISGNYTVYKVVHQLTERGDFTTKLDVGGIKKDENDYLFRNVTKKVNICYKNQSKT